MINDASKQAIAVNYIDRNVAEKLRLTRNMSEQQKETIKNECKKLLDIQEQVYRGNRAVIDNIIAEIGGNVDDRC